MTYSNITIQDVINCTNDKIITWYKNAKLDYNVTGSGKTYYSEKDNTIRVEYTENGIDKVWEMPFYDEYVENGIDWVYRCWSELS